MKIEVIPYTPTYKNHFISLNKAWLNTYFKVEKHDNDVFENIEEVVLQPGGEIFFCLVDGIVAGTVAMQYVDATTFELAKLAVADNFKGQKLSNYLMEACISFAIAKKASTIMLLSNRKLVPALNLYLKYGFVEVPMEDTDYERANIQMELYL